ncbi:hypothetical protein RFI_32580 [Reticulomyxa filosa]|uniref:Uncharacterized protein n=1 Tax=Reticulomyxa filosa TaxID=46433 RepID=X6LTX3_RETFI|nr:hypothetical protein RFI_32580 [Reticulomyxa filosa]|eukprot:ETO04816.1 hypothetical protein RFI_32580 [Reticulomyxa filosa]
MSNIIALYQRLAIGYDEDNNTFQFHQLPICDDIASLFKYAYVRVNDAILFFGGCNSNNYDDSKSGIHRFILIEVKLDGQQLDDVEFFMDGLDGKYENIDEICALSIAKIALNLNKRQLNKVFEFLMTFE